MHDFVSLFALAALFLIEFILNLVAHAMALRLAMCHTLVFLLFNVGQVYDLLRSTKRKAHVSFAKSKVDVDTFVTFLYAVAFVVIFGFVVVNILHSLQLLVHRHDMDVHHGLVVLLVGGADFLIKLFIWPLLDCGFVQTTICSKVRKALFYLTASVLLLVIASLRCISDWNRLLVLWLDPTLTMLACSVICFAAFEPAKEFLYTLLLAAPRNVNVNEVTLLLRHQFPEAEIHDLHIWRESKSRVAASAHIRMESENHYRVLAEQIHNFFHCLGVNRIVLQPEFEKPQEIENDNSCILPCPC